MTFEQVMWDRFGWWLLVLHSWPVVVWLTVLAYALIDTARYTRVYRRMRAIEVSLAEIAVALRKG